MKRWEHRFEVKPGRWVYVPTPIGKAAGEKIRSSVAKVWSRPKFYFHLRKGGHVAALRRHLKNQYFFRCDLDDFFGRINQSRVTRSLKENFSYVDARKMASDSVVIRPGTGKTMLPYGYVQSPILASFALDRSRVGRFLRKCESSEDVTVSVYMDDIVLSSNDEARLYVAAAELAQLATDAGLPLNAGKTIGPASTVTAFNVELSHGLLSVTKERIDRFRESYATASSLHVELGIVNYVHSINSTQVAAVTT
ncbi:reverse transcriptase domain-containing protein [Xanthomonas campestris pv. campestris]|uniref:reverse transcriptase domain-containing protein n=1 Tax=Xanthomonas campestris TaxID=339 RepID=UPI0025A1E0BB|nr:reverse transcriptase domain-containing protein [Xanthomonas campestris]MDM7672842.1 reverse transcriptase domain-containing protein [Xanthomonas campestris pv. campestris]